MTTIQLDLDSLEHQLRQDPEFALNSRYLNAKIRVVIGDSQSFQIVIRDGAIDQIDPVVTPFDAYDIQLVGTEEHWAFLLASTPPAFYQDFYPAMVHHGFRIEGDMEMIIAYYPGLRRLGDIFRTVVATAVSA